MPQRRSTPPKKTPQFPLPRNVPIQLPETLKFAPQKRSNFSHQRDAPILSQGHSNSPLSERRSNPSSPLNLITSRNVPSPVQMPQFFLRNTPIESPTQTVLYCIKIIPRQRLEMGHNGPQILSPGCFPEWTLWGTPKNKHQTLNTGNAPPSNVQSFGGSENHQPRP